MTRYEHYKTMMFSLRERILTVTLNRPEKLNVFTEEMEYELTQFLVDGALDQDFDIVILTGAGRAFSAGGDVENWMVKNVEDPGRVRTELSKRVVFSILDFPKPIIAKLNGHAIGLGATVALFCDVIFASNEAKIADPHVKMGLSAGDGGAIIWPQLIGYARAREYLMTGELIPGAQGGRDRPHQLFAAAGGTRRRRRGLCAEALQRGAARDLRHQADHQSRPQAGGDRGDGRQHRL